MADSIAECRTQWFRSLPDRAVLTLLFIKFYVFTETYKYFTTLAQNPAIWTDYEAFKRKSNRL